MVWILKIYFFCIVSISNLVSWSIIWHSGTISEIYARPSATRQWYAGQTDLYRCVDSRVLIKKFWFLFSRWRSQWGLNFQNMMMLSVLNWWTSCIQNVTCCLKIAGVGLLFEGQGHILSCEFWETFTFLCYLQLFCFCFYLPDIYLFTLMHQKWLCFSDSGALPRYIYIYVK